MYLRTGGFSDSCERPDSYSERLAAPAVNADGVSYIHRIADIDGMRDCDGGSDGDRAADTDGVSDVHRMGDIDRVCDINGTAYRSKFAPVRLDADGVCDVYDVCDIHRMSDIDDASNNDRIPDIDRVRDLDRIARRHRTADRNRMRRQCRPARGSGVSDNRRISDDYCLVLVVHDTAATAGSTVGGAGGVDRNGKAEYGYD